MLSTPDGPFINLARLNMSKYAARPNLSKSLFEYIFHHENDVRNVSKSLFILKPHWLNSGRPLPNKVWKKEDLLLCHYLVTSLLEIAFSSRFSQFSAQPLIVFWKFLPIVLLMSSWRWINSVSRWDVHLFCTFRNWLIKRGRFRLKYPSSPAVSQHVVRQNRMTVWPVVNPPPSAFIDVRHCYLPFICKFKIPLHLPGHSELILCWPVFGEHTRTDTSAIFNLCG